MLRITSAAVLTASLVSACAYGYAGQEGKTSPEPEPTTNVKVVTVKESSRPSDEEERRKSEPQVAQTQEPESPCGVRTFEIYYFDRQNRVSKTIDCVARKIVDENEGTISESTYADWRAAGLPDSSWYILVDPKGVRADYLTNSHLLKLSRQFQIDYFGRDAGRDLLVYLYDDSLK